MRIGWSRLGSIALLAMLIAIASGTAGGARAASPYTDEELIRGFVLTVFGAEAADSPHDRSGSDVVKKFTGPVRYQIVSTAATDWSDTVRAFAESLGASVNHLSLAETADPDAANMTIFLVDRADYRETIERTVWEGVDKAFLEENACSAVLAARRSGIERAYIYIVADEGFLSLSHCLVEELSQSLGPANDSDELRDSIFNDSSTLSVFGVFDWFILSMLYDPRIAAGMTEAEVVPLLPAVIHDARERLEALFEGGSPALVHSELVPSARR